VNVNFLYDIVHEEQKARGLKHTAYSFRAPAPPNQLFLLTTVTTGGLGPTFGLHVYLLKIHPGSMAPSYAWGALGQLSPMYLLSLRQ